MQTMRFLDFDDCVPYTHADESRTIPVGTPLWMPWPEFTRIGNALLSSEDRQILARAMIEPLMIGFDYQGIGRKAFMVDELPRWVLGPIRFLDVEEEL